MIRRVVMYMVRAWVYRRRKKGFEINWRYVLSIDKTGQTHCPDS